MTGFGHTVTFTLSLLILIFQVSCDSLQVTKLYQNGAVTSASPIASEVGSSVFRQGGNAFDVAVAVGFALAVVHPQAGNLGGGGFAVIRDGKTGDILSLDFREKAPALASEKMFLDSDNNVIDNLSTQSPLAVGVPGTVSGLHALWQQYGSLP